MEKDASHQSQNKDDNVLREGLEWPSLLLTDLEIIKSFSTIGPVAKTITLQQASKGGRA
jgi:hypothetical protein